MLDESEITGLATAFRQGDQESFRLLVESMSRTLMAMAYRYTRDWEWARDLTQDTWAKVAQEIQGFDPRRSFSAWLFAIHRNRCADHLRQPRLRLEASRDQEGTPEPAASPAHGPDQEMERREFQERILRAARGLSAMQREVFLRVDVEQGEQRAVARALGIRDGTLRVTLHHARKRMAQALRRMEEST
jgi:RNA polymerase sigma-70 factor (ECF subfamily)